MAVVTITFIDCEDGSVDVEINNSNAGEQGATFANFHGFAYRQFEEEIMERANLLNSIYKKGAKDGTR